MHITDKKKQFNKTLFAWHKNHYRDMAWRRTHDPYEILISEVMLQQTQVERVREKYTLFLKQFPNVQALASAPLGEVLRSWSGLGYNRRAKYLHECAKIVTREHKGKFPKTYEELILLPGVGMSTAGALLAFAFRKETPMIDTNIRRILIRVFFPHCQGVALTMPSDKELYVFAAGLIPEGKGRMWNYAMLDLGASLCSARGHTDDCPLTPLHGRVGDFVYKKPQKKFAGSDRFYRGRILAQLAAGSASSKQLQSELMLDDTALQVILTKLIIEGLVVEIKSRYSLPS